MHPAENFKDQINAFEKKLGLISIGDITTVSYVKKYLAHLLEHKRYYLAIYADVFRKLIQHSSKAKEDISLIDFGSGNGMLGIFAKFCGFRKVFLNDIDAKFIEASERLSEQLGIEIDGYIAGDITAARACFKNEFPDAIIGTDVIEHIYNLESFLKALLK